MADAGDAHATAKDARTGDAIDVSLILVPVSSLTGNDVAGELAANKGKGHRT